MSFWCHCCMQYSRIVNSINLFVLSHGSLSLVASVSTPLVTPIRHIDSTWCEHAVPNAFQRHRETLWRDRLFNGTMQHNAARFMHFTFLRASGACGNHIAHAACFTIGSRCVLRSGPPACHLRVLQMAPTRCMTPPVAATGHSCRVFCSCKCWVWGTSSTLH